MVSTVQAAWGTRHRLQEVGPPYGPVDHDRPSRIDRTLQLPPFDQPYLKADTTLGALLARQGIRIDEVQVTHHHTDSLETKDVEHDALLATRTNSFPAARPAGYDPGRPGGPGSGHR
jgi:hypothetical protein